MVESDFGLPLIVYSLMSFWKPGEAYPDNMVEEEMETEDIIALDDSPVKRSSEKVKLSETTKNLPVEFVLSVSFRSS